jgi:hypothetical protein
MSRLNWKRIVFLFAALLFLGRYLFSHLGFTEEDRVLQAIDSMQEAVQNKSLFRFQSLLSADYSDHSGLDRGMMLRLAGVYFRGQDSVRILRMSSSVELLAESRARVALRVQVFGKSEGSWSRGLSDSSILGEDYTVRLKKEGGSWKITSVDPDKRSWPKPF